MTQSKSTNVHWHEGRVSRADRERAHGHRGVTVWLTGLSGSGKSTIAHRVEQILIERGCFAYVLDGDNVRHGLCADLGFSAEDRAENIRRIGEVVKLFTEAGAIAISAFISPYRADRDRVRALHAEGDFVEVHVDAPLEVCESRDPKGLYRKARAGEIRDFTGIDAPYEPPEHPELVLDTASRDLEGCASELVAYLEARGIVKGP